jgi:hypothetical protein
MERRAESPAGCGRVRRGPGRFRPRHPRAAHGWVARRLNWVEFTNAEANGARRSSPFLFAPFFFGLPPHGWCIRVLHLEPIGRAAGTVGGSLSASRRCLQAHVFVFVILAAEVCYATLNVQNTGRFKSPDALRSAPAPEILDVADPCSSIARFQEPDFVACGGIDRWPFARHSLHSTKGIGDVSV